MFVRRYKVSCLLFAALVLLACGVAVLAQAPAAVPAAAPAPADQSAAAPPPVSKYDKALFQKLIPADQLTFLNQFNGVQAKDVFHDKQFRKLVKSIAPDGMFHYGKDMPLMDALDLVFEKSAAPVLVRENRYVLLSGLGGPYLGGRGFLWFDMQDGIGLGGFFFQPTNGEPTPAFNVFSRQVVKEDILSLHQLPPAFIDDMVQWATAARVPPLSTRYFITGSNKKILLDHDEDYCTLADGTPAPTDSHCEEMTADAADIDMNAASYLDQTHHATNSTAWMINSPDQVAWLQVRTSTCGPGPNQLACRIHMTRERTQVIVHRGGGGGGGGHGHR